MARPIVMISRHPYGSLIQGGRCLAPTGEVDIHFVTHARGGSDGLDHTLFRNVTVCSDSTDFEELRSACSWLIREYSAERIVAVHEKVMMVAAELRDEFGLPGPGVETTRLFRDKVRMKQVVIEANAARVPAFAPLDTMEDLRAWDWSTGRKVIKSRLGAGSQDVYFADTLAEAERLAGRLDLSGGSFEVEEFIDGPMYHCDAIVQDGDVRFAAVCEYISKPGDFVPGGVGGSILLSPDDLLCKRVLELNARVLKALGLQEGATHLEVFHTAEDDLVFCEVAARPGGGGIDRIIENSYGVNILEASLRLQAGLDIGREPVAGDGDDVWGVIGFYPGAEPSEGVAPARFAELGIAEYVRGGRAGDGAGGVRHCTDYQHKYVLSGAGRTQLDARIRAIRQEYDARR